MSSHKDDAAVELMITVYWMIDVSGAFLGLLTNSILIIATLRTSGKLQSYSYLFLVTAIFDLAFSCVELLTQHQLVVRNGVMFILPHGIETAAPKALSWLFLFSHGFVTTHGLFILGAQYKYRHDLITKPATSLKDLLKVLALTCSCGIFTGISFAFSIYESKSRGDDYYRNLMDGEWFNEKARRYFMYATDIQDLSCQLFVCGGLILSTFWISVSIYYFWRAWAYVNRNQVERSERTKALQTQFTISLVIQTVNACLFAVTPISLVCISIIFRLDAEFLGMGVMSPLSWLPAANALITMCIIKAYRDYVRSLFCRNQNSTLTTITASRTPSKFVDNRSNVHSTMNSRYKQPNNVRHLDAYI